jgi:hypothetical protein
MGRLRLPLKKKFAMAANTDMMIMFQSSGSGKKAEALDDLLHHLGIEDDEIDGLIFEEEETSSKERIKWMALVRVHTSNTTLALKRLNKT